MARIRSIHPDACDSDKLAAVSADAERLFWRLQTHCDDFGKCEDKPRLIFARCVPLVDGWDTDRVDVVLEELAAVGLLERYVVDGARFIRVPQWSRFQHPQKRGKDTLPDPDESGSADPEPDGEDRSRTSRVPLSPGGEGRGEGEERNGETPSLELVAESEPVPTVSFEDFWKVYPHKRDKGHAEKAWKAAIRKADPELILEAIRHQAPSIASRKPEYRPHAATWLNGQRWLDPADLPKFSSNDATIAEVFA